MKILCSLSSIEYEVQHFPAYLQSGECHPIFSLPQKKLISIASSKYFNGELTEIDSYLLFLALLNSTELIKWMVPAKRTIHTNALISNNMQSLVQMCGKINAIHHPAFVLPKFAITSETRTLENVKYWIQAWESQYTEFLSGLKDQELRDRLSRREAALEKLIKNPAIDPSKYSKLLAEWAAEAGEFPTFTITSPLDKSEIKISEYWKQIIQKCYRSESIISIPEADLIELLEHCENNIEAGSIYSFHLFSTLREGRDRQKNFLGIDLTASLSAENPGFRILSPDDNIEDAAIQSLIDAAPINKPERKDYPSAFAYMKAQMRWELAQKHKGDSSNGQA